MNKPVRLRVQEDMKGMLEARALALHSTNTRIVNTTPKRGFDFLGCHIERRMR
ncbi:MAG: hypothetical protein HRU72_02800 [Planctomycetia bacterium]|uniref:hypothetical protein n=1 Tax=Candidatus Brocadia sapporoensis TaxID=392547 RepID=UPI0015C4AEA4|nr:hypothetical protein [Candidatus Brocadia sapporoensis]MCC7238335.1 hypothetical protein [Candidatus Brocadia sp.]QOJ05545.1 MAG: hypothetical protein HRU72_02800 [Planctomycetia bacterium]HQU29928.1 hypothetical protein [Candidatus Brocadia sapporoensis]